MKRKKLVWHSVPYQQQPRKKSVSWEGMFRAFPLYDFIIIVGCPEPWGERRGLHFCTMLYSTRKRPFSELYMFLCFWLTASDCTLKRVCCVRYWINVPPRIEPFARDSEVDIACEYFVSAKVMVNFDAAQRDKRPTTIIINRIGE